MGRNNICVIYDSDENYAKRLMSVINDDNDIPYNAQVFTKEHELDKYLQEKEADMLMICEGAYGYNAYRTGNKTVVLCEEEREADEINSREEKGLVGICKYQPSYQLLQSVMRYEKKDRVQKRGSLKVTGVYGFNNTARMMLSLAVARLMSEHGNTLFINFETFYGFKGILKGEENENLSDALYAFRQNHNQFHKNIVNAISHYERLDYIPDASCAEDIDDIKPEEMGTFIQAIGRELGYSNIVIDIGDGIRMPWNIKASLRMRPDRIVVGEVRGPEAIDMLQAMNTGHDGSLSTGHANSPKDMLTRLETMVLMGMDMPVSAIRAQISSAIDIIVHLARLRDKSRKVVQIAEVGDCINGEIVLTPLFKFVENSQDKHGKVIGTLVRQNNVFNRTEKLKAAGFSEW